MGSASEGWVNRLLPQVRVVAPGLLAVYLIGTGTTEMREPGTECSVPGSWRGSRDLDGPHGLGLRSPVALRDFELHPLALFEGAVAICLDGGEVDEDVPTTVDRDEAVALVRVEPFDGALSHYQQLPNFCSGCGFRPCYAEPV